MADPRCKICGAAEHNLRANRAEGEAHRLRTGVANLRSAIHACNRNPIPNSQRIKWREMCDALMSVTGDKADG